MPESLSALICRLLGLEDLSLLLISSTKCRVVQQCICQTLIRGGLNGGVRLRLVERKVLYSMMRQIVSLVVV